MRFIFFFFNDTATTEIYTLSLHDALPISVRTLAKHLRVSRMMVHRVWQRFDIQPHRVEKFKLSNDPQFEEKVRDIAGLYLDRKSTRLNSSHGYISYAVFCLKKKRSPASRRSATAAPSTAPAPPRRPLRPARGPNRPGAPRRQDRLAAQPSAPPRPAAVRAAG